LKRLLYKLHLIFLFNYLRLLLNWLNRNNYRLIILYDIFFRHLHFLFRRLNYFWCLNRWHYILLDHLISLLLLNFHIIIDLRSYFHICIFSIFFQGLLINILL
jgi:hypothetical protein